MGIWTREGPCGKSQECERAHGRQWPLRLEREGRPEYKERASSVKPMSLGLAKLAIEKEQVILTREESPSAVWGTPATQSPKLLASNTDARPSDLLSGDGILEKARILRVPRNVSILKVEKCCSKFQLEYHETLIFLNHHLI